MFSFDNDLENDICMDVLDMDCDRWAEDTCDYDELFLEIHGEILC